MRAAWYERQGPADEVLQVGERERPEPGPREVRVRIRASGVNPSDTYARSGRQGPMAFQWVIPHQDGAGTIDGVGEGLPPGRVGERVWVYEATWIRPGNQGTFHVANPQATQATAVRRATRHCTAEPDTGAALS